MGGGGWVRNSSEAGQLCSSLMIIKCSAVFSYVLRDLVEGLGGGHSEDEPCGVWQKERILASSALPEAKCTQGHPCPALNQVTPTEAAPTRTRKLPFTNGWHGLRATRPVLN